MAVNLSDNIQINAPKPTDSRYLNNLSPWASVSAVNTALAGGVGGVRYSGLTVNILGVEYWYSGGIGDSNLVIKSASAGSSASGQRITKMINLTSHGFTGGTVIGWSGGTYNRAISNGLYDGEILGIVSKCYNANCFDLTQAGYVTGLTSLSINSTYFLSDVTAGMITTNKPTLAGHLVKSVLVADSTTSAWVLPYPAYKLSVSSGGTSSLSTFTITGNSSATGFTVNHAKNKQFVNVEVVKNSSPYSTVYTDVLRPNANCVCITFTTPPATGQQYKILIIN